MPSDDEPAPDGATRKLLHDEEAQPVGLDEVVDGDDVGMVESRQQPGLGHEPRPDGRVGGEGPGQLLDRHLAPELAVARLQDDTPAAAAELGAQLVGRQRGGHEVAVERHTGSVAVATSSFSASASASSRSSSSRASSSSSSSSSGAGVR